MALRSPRTNGLNAKSGSLVAALANKASLRTRTTALHGSLVWRPPLNANTLDQQRAFSQDRQNRVPRTSLVRSTNVFAYAGIAHRKHEAHGPTVYL